jgi:hypothetical protein
MLEKYFRVFKEALQEDSSLAQQIRYRLATVSFSESSAPLGTTLRRLRQFCGGLAAIFPGTPSVELDYGAINWIAAISALL